MRAKISITFFIFSMLSFSIRADSRPAQLVSANIQTTFEPQQCIFLVSDSAQMKMLLKAEFTQSGRMRSDEEVEYLAAAALPIQSGELQHALVCQAGNKIATSTVATIAASKLIPSILTTLKQEVELRAEELHQTKQKIIEQENKIRRLKADVNIIADISRIVVLREERMRAEALVESLEQEGKVLTESLKMVRAQGKPPGYVGLEGNLTRVLSEYTQVQEKSKKR